MEISFDINDKALHEEIDDDMDEKEVNKSDKIITAGGDDEPEFMIPLDSMIKLKPFVDRYFIKYYKNLIHPQYPNMCCNQYAFCHTNKLLPSILLY